MKKGVGLRGGYNVDHSVQRAEGIFSKRVLVKDVTCLRRCGNLLLDFVQTLLRGLGQLFEHLLGRFHGRIRPS